MLGWVLKYRVFSQSPVYRAVPAMSMKEPEIAAKNRTPRRAELVRGHGGNHNKKAATRAALKRCLN
jgi:hypothetical protein